MWIHVVYMVVLMWQCVHLLDPSVVTNVTGGTFDILNSPSQLGRASDANVIVVAGSKPFDTGTTTILKRFACSNYKMIFSSDDPSLPLQITVFLQDISDSVKKASCNVDWGDGSECPVEDMDDRLGAVYTYAISGVYKVSISCESKEEGPDTVCPESPNNAACVTTSEFFDAFYRSFVTPMVFFTTDEIAMKSYMELDPSCNGVAPEIHWRLTFVNGTEIVDVSNFDQPNTSVLRLPPESLEPGLYILHLEVVFPNENMVPIYWVEDTTIIKVILPELISFIDGGDKIDATEGDVITINATKSRDPVTTLASVVSQPLVATWSVAYFTSEPSTVYTNFIRLFPNTNLPTSPAPVKYQVTQGTDYLLQVDSYTYGLDSYIIVMLSLTRELRSSSAFQMIRFVSKAVPISIECVFNCQLGRERKFNQDKIELDAVLPGTLFDLTEFTFTWSLTYYGGILNPYYTSYPTSTSTGFTTRSLGLLKDVFTSGYSYTISVDVIAPGYTDTNVRMSRHVNFIPYSGTCTMNTLVGKAARDWFTMSCDNWRGSDDRLVRVATSPDLNPILTYTVRQKTIGALVEEEPILQSRARRSHVIVKVGDPANNYFSELMVRISDIYGNFAEVALSITANPAILWYDVKATEAGAALVTSYTSVDYRFDEQQLRDMGKVDMIIPLVSSVCSHLHLIDLPVWEPPVPRVLNTNNSILDLNPSENTDLGNLNEASEKIKQRPLDPATLACQEVMQNMTAVIRESVERYVINGTRSDDKLFMSTLTNAFTNLASKENFVNLETKVDMIWLSYEVGIGALKPRNFTADDSAQIQEASGETYFMAQAIVNAVVPDELRQARNVKNVHEGGTLIDNMLELVDTGINIEESKLAPWERAELYRQLQGRTKFEIAKKKETAKKAAELALKLAKRVQDRLKVCKTCANQDSNSTDQLVKKNEASLILNNTIKTQTYNFVLTGLKDVLGKEGLSSPTSVSAIEFTENVFMYDDDGTSSFVTSNILHVDVKSSDVRVTPPNMTFYQTVKTPEAKLTQPLVDPEDASEFSLHKFLYQTNTDYVCIRLKPINEELVSSYSVFLNFLNAPSLLDFDFQLVISKLENWHKCIPPSDMNGHSGMTYLGIAVPGSLKTMSYYFTIITVSCMTWDETDRKWYTDKCDMEWSPYADKITCLCSNLTELTFGNSFYVTPNSIDFSTVFLKFSPLNQAAVMGAIIGIFIIYIFTVVIVMDLDRQDVVKWGITPLRDNLFLDDVFYIIKVFTGMRRGAGTKSRIAFNLTGRNGTTGNREMFDGVREEFSTGSVMSFFLATKRDLGRLLHLYIWHDNSGQGDFASWYLNQVLIYDIAQKETYTFVAEQWLSVETSVDVNLQSSSSKEKVQFESRFFYQTRDGLSDSHMWVSIMYRPEISIFTRVQRASCALVYILLTMIANAMYFNPGDEYQTPPLLQIGPLRFSTQQIYISIICALMTTPVVMLIIFMFKMTKRKQIDLKSKHSTCCHGCTCACRKSRKSKQGELLQKIMLCYGIPKFKGGLYLHPRFIYLAWFLVIAGTIVPAFFVILYSMEWGKQKSEEWLTAFLMSLVESVFIVDPITVICIALLLACIIKINKEDTNVDINLVVDNYKRMRGQDEDQPLTFISKILTSIKEENNSYKLLPLAISPPLKGDNLKRAAEQRRHHVKLIRMIRDIILNVIFMIVVVIICYGNKDSRSYYHRADIVNQIVTPLNKPHFEKIKTPGELFQWMNVSVFPSLFPETDVTGNPLHWQIRRFTSGNYNLRVGPPRLRQLRTTEKMCELPFIGRVRCFGEYTIFSEDETNYCLGWTPEPCSLSTQVFNMSNEAWQFTSALDIWGLPIPGFYTTYGGGGYISNFDINLNISISILQELYDSLWLDRQTRAVMLEFTLYCAETNIFIYNMFMVEFPQTGGAFRSYQIYPIRVYNRQGPTGNVVLICEAIFVLILIVLIVKICIRIYQQRKSFFGQFWNVYELFMFLLGCGSIGLFFIRMGFTNLTIEKFKADIRLFVNFSHIVFWDQVLVALLSILVFMVTIRILEVFSSSKKVNAIVKIFAGCGADLFWFGTTFFYIFLGFCGLGMLLFGHQLLHYMNIYRCMGTLLISMIGKSKFTEINATQPILAKVFFFLYILAIVFFTLTIFLSILGSTIDEVMHDTRRDSREDLMEFMMTKFKKIVVKHNPLDMKRKGKVTPIPEFEEAETPKEQRKKPSVDYRHIETKL